ncbi:hypothetical protein F0L17_16065 [Streptomyces sp. TRM43335]|uniref:Uncharacterized protein n=1 Tax=Streptomyces taklimakanensis TaxID=2569853 RepID=A0A6G2BE86_9ACTN|nr:hypothetical protein [Streptomyces taklimakanensis]MTE20595.1 hypothetical protein [Streptomyces taklimakanensis]
MPMRDLLASCAAADAVSTPPAPDSESDSDVEGRPDGGRGPEAEAA